MLNQLLLSSISFLSFSPIYYSYSYIINSKKKKKKKKNSLKNQLSFPEVQEAISHMLERSIRQAENVAVPLAHTLQQGLRKKV